MHLYLEALTPQGVSATVHKVTRAEASANGLEVTVTSYANETSDLPVWQDRHAMPVEEFTSYPQSIYDWLAGATGPLAGGVQVASPSNVDDLRRTRKKLVETLRDKHIAGGVNVPGVGIIDSDDVSIRNVGNACQQATLAKMASAPFEISWRLKDNTEVVLDADDVIAMHTAGTMHVSACYARSWVLKSELDAATTEQEVDAVLVGSGWPE